MRVFSDTELMITNDLNDSTAFHFATGTLRDHPLKLLTQCGESLKARLHLL